MPDVKTHDLGYLRLDLPETWKDEILLCTVQGPARPGSTQSVRPIVTVTYDKLAKGESLEKKAEKRVAELESAGAQGRMVWVEESEPRTIDGYSALQLRLLVVESVGTMAWTMLLVDRGGDGERAMPVVTCASLADEAALHAPIFEKVIASILFEEIAVEFSDEEERTDPNISLPFALPQDD